jgi:hypothetical protein
VAQKLDLAFQLTANADGMAAGVAKADRELSQVGASAKATSAEFRQAAKITAELRTPAEKYADTIGKLDKMMQKGLLSQDVYGRAVAKADAELQAATSTMDEMASKAGIAERVVNGLSGAIGGIGDATKSVADAGVSVIAFGKDIAYTYLQWKVFSAIRNPAGLKDFAIGAVKGAMAARTMILAAKALGVGLALGGGAAGTAAAAVLGLSNPLIGGALLALNLGKAFLNAKDRALEMASGITAGTVSLEALNAEIGQLQAQQVDNLAFAMEEATAAGERSESAFTGLADVFVTPFIGAFAAIQSGLAGFTDGISSVVEGITSILAPVAEVLQPLLTYTGMIIEAFTKWAGVILSVVGLGLKLNGVFIRLFLSPFIVGLTNVVETMRSGMNAAFDFIGERIDWASQKIKDFYAYMSDVPIIGRAFAGGPGANKIGKAEGGNPAFGANAAAEEARSLNSEQLDFELLMYTTRLQNEEAIAEARRQASSKQLEDDLQAYGERHALEQQIADANKKAAQDKLDADLEAYGAQRAMQQQIEEFDRERQEKVAEKQAEIDKFTAERMSSLGGKSNESLKATDVRSSEGMSQFIALATGREDPAIAEYRKQTQKLEELKAELRALGQQQVDILGAAA